MKVKDLLTELMNYDQEQEVFTFNAEQNETLKVISVEAGRTDLDDGSEAAVIILICKLEAYRSTTHKCRSYLKQR